LIEAIITLVIATGVLLGSPGPATLSLAAVGATFGVSSGLPYLAGILLGLMFAMAGAVFGVAAVFVEWPEARWIIQSLGAAYLLYVAFRIATAPIVAKGTAAPQDIPAFRDGFILNLLNPKAYAAFFVLFSQFLLPNLNTPISYSITALVVAAVAVLVDSLWLIVGSTIHAVFTNPKTARATRVLFALSIIIATIWALL
jgi:threonine/homoserine/homoserine lactone efflux protein